MVESFGIPKSEVAGWVGIATAVVPGGQTIMGIPWGLLADHSGRKPVMLFCLTCGMVFALLTGLSRSLLGLILARGGLGLVSGNVGIARAMAAEMVPQKELRAEAFNILYVTLSIAGIFGPVLGGTLADLASRYPESLGQSRLLAEYPFLLPNLVGAVLFLAGIIIGFLLLEVRRSYSPFPPADIVN
jgi:MFS family permease